jgi:DNA mismatch endonuclease, patch repair protein
MDNLTPKQRKKNMQNIRSEGTYPEKMIMSELRKAKIYFSTHAKNIFGKPDIVFRRKKIAVFVDSDFWHKHPTRFVKPKTNTKYWINKINRNQQRDKIVTKQLRKNGWRVIRVWEHSIKKSSSQCSKKIIEEYNKAS